MKRKAYLIKHKTLLDAGFKSSVDNTLIVANENIYINTANLEDPKRVVLIPEETIDQRIKDAKLSPFVKIGTITLTGSVLPTSGEIQAEYVANGLILDDGKVVLPSNPTLDPNIIAVQANEAILFVSIVTGEQQLANFDGTQWRIDSSNDVILKDLRAVKEQITEWKGNTKDRVVTETIGDDLYLKKDNRVTKTDDIVDQREFANSQAAQDRNVQLEVGRVNSAITDAKDRITNLENQNNPKQVFAGKAVLIADLPLAPTITGPSLPTQATIDLSTVAYDSNGSRFIFGGQDIYLDFLIENQDIGNREFTAVINTDGVTRNIVIGDNANSDFAHLFSYDINVSALGIVTFSRKIVDSTNFSTIKLRKIEQDIVVRFAVDQAQLDKVKTDLAQLLTTVQLSTDPLLNTVNKGIAQAINELLARLDADDVNLADLARDLALLKTYFTNNSELLTSNQAGTGLVAKLGEGYTGVIEIGNGSGGISIGAGIDGFISLFLAGRGNFSVGTSVPNQNQLLIDGTESATFKDIIAMVKQKQGIRLLYPKGMIVGFPTTFTPNAALWEAVPGMIVGDTLVHGTSEGRVTGEVISHNHTARFNSNFVAKGIDWQAYVPINPPNPAGALYNSLPTGGNSNFAAGIKVKYWRAKVDIFFGDLDDTTALLLAQLTTVPADVTALKTADTNIGTRLTALEARPAGAAPTWKKWANTTATVDVTKQYRFRYGARTVYFSNITQAEMDSGMVRSQDFRWNIGQRTTIGIYTSSGSLATTIPLNTTTNYIEVLE